jgi:hypothetical protein
MSKKQIIRSYQFRSKADANVLYTLLLFSNGEISCNCRAFTSHQAADGSRICPHVIAAGLSANKTTTHGAAQPAVVKVQPQKHGASAKIPTIINRRFGFDD